MLFLTAALEKDYYSAAILRQHSWDGYDFYMVWRKHHEKKNCSIVVRRGIGSGQPCGADDGAGGHDERVQL